VASRGSSVLNLRWLYDVARLPVSHVMSGITPDIALTRRAIVRVVMRVESLPETFARSTNYNIDYTCTPTRSRVMRRPVIEPSDYRVVTPLLGVMRSAIRGLHQRQSSRAASSGIFPSERGGKEKEEGEAEVETGQLPSGTRSRPSPPLPPSPVTLSSSTGNSRARK